MTTWTVQHFGYTLRVVSSTGEEVLPPTPKSCAGAVIALVQAHNRTVERKPVNGVSLNHEDRRILVTKSTEPEDDMF